jgi:hypothetical protein
MKYAPRANRHERRQMHAEKLASDLGGSGLYIYENNTDGDLKLPKSTPTGVRSIGPRKRFQGDSYFMSLVGSPMNLLRLIEEITPKKTTQEIADEIAHKKENKTMPEHKLILDQPDTITNKGKIEHVVSSDSPVQPLNDSSGAKPHGDVLLNENPLDGVAIIKN